MNEEPMKAVKMIKTLQWYVMAIILVPIAIPFLLVALFLTKDSKSKYKEWLKDSFLPVITEVKQLVNS